MRLSCFWPLAATLCLSACTSNGTERPSSEPKSTSETTAPVIRPLPGVVHTARYTLVSLTPETALRQPLRQVTQHTFPRSSRKPPLTRGDGLRAWLAGTGYGLCLPVSRESRWLFSSPLPDVWRHAGPMRVEAALQAMAGPAWQMTTDEVSRTVCFQQVSPESHTGEKG